jgi:hypothetical protein
MPAFDEPAFDNLAFDNLAFDDTDARYLAELT